MSDSPFFEYWKHFHAVSESHNLSSFARLIYYRLLEEFNKKHWELTEIQLTDRDVQRMTNIRSLKSIVDAKSELNRVNLMRITNRKNKPTIYELLSPTNRNKHEISTKQARNKHEISTAFIKYTLNTGKEEDKRREDGGTRTRETAATDSDKYCSAALKNAWIMHSGMNPNDGICMKLGALEQTYGTERVKAAIEEANARNQAGTINFNFVQSVLMRMINGSLTKGVNSYGERKSHHNADEHKSPYDDL